MVVDLRTVMPRKSREEWAIRHMKKVLFQQGQIEPLQINPRTTKPHVEDVWGDSIWYAAYDLGWETILITLTDRYEE